MISDDNWFGIIARPICIRAGSFQSSARTKCADPHPFFWIKSAGCTTVPCTLIHTWQWGRHFAARGSTFKGEIGKISRKQTNPPLPFFCLCICLLNVNIKLFFYTFIPPDILPGHRRIQWHTEMLTSRHCCGGVYLHCECEWMRANIRNLQLRPKYSIEVHWVHRGPGCVIVDHKYSQKGTLFLKNAWRKMWTPIYF